MKKILLSVLMGLMGLSGLRAQQCDTVRLFPWDNDFYSDFGCWEQLGDSSSLWQPNADNNYNFENAAYITAPCDSAADGCVLVSPALALPADTAGMRLSFKTRRVGTAAQLRVLVSTGQRENMAGYDTLLSVTPSGINSYEVNLSAYAGQTIYVAFSIVKPTQSYNMTFFGVGSVNILSDHMPQGEWLIQNMAARTADTVEHEFYLTQGIETDSNATFLWHSTMVAAGQATLVEVVTDMLYDYATERLLPRSIYRVVYHTPGIDTVTVVVSNLYGTITSQSVSHVYDCAPIASFPWEMEFGDLGVCWSTDYSIHNNATYGFTDEDGEIYSTDCYLQSPSYTENFVVTNAIAVPADAAHLALTLRWRLGVVEVRAARVDQNDNMWDYLLDTTLFTDLLFNESATSVLNTRKVNLAAYAGDTIRLAVFHKSSNVMYLMPLSIDYDTLPKIASVQVPSLATVGDSALCTASLRYGATDGLHYSWTSAQGGVFVTNALGDSAWVTYPSGVGERDTIRVVAENAYGADTVVRSLRILDCTPQLVLPWKETFSDGITCWYKPEGSNWTTGSYYGYEPKTMASSCNNSPAPHWIMSKAVVLPADTALGMRLFWDAATTYTAYQQNCGVYVTTSEDYTDTANYTLLYLDTAYHTAYTAFDHLSVPLTAYAGQTVHVAFRNMPYNFSTSATLHIDNVTIRTTVEPIVSLAATTQALSHEPVTHTATLTEGSTNGLTITWHSTLMDTTWVMNGSDGVNGQFGLEMMYTFGGRDTITVTASNIYGSSSASAVVIVTDCSPIDSLPYEETFNGVISATYNTSSGGNVPSCWHRYWNGSTNYMPHVINSYLNQTAIHTYVQSDRALVLMAGVDSGWDTVATVESPLFEAPLNEQLLSFYYMYESSNRGVLSVGYLQDGAFVEVASLEPQTAGRTDTVSLSAFPADVHRFALQWKQSVSSWYGVIVDNIRVFAPDTLPSVRLTAPVTAFVGDSAHFSATLSNGLPNGLTYTWHSTMLGNLNGFNGQCGVVYSAEGIDTVTVIATNAYGSDTAWAVVTVGSHPLPQVTLTAPATVVMPASATYLIALNDCSQNGLTVSWHSTMLGDLDGFSEFNVFSGQCVVVYPAEGIDTVTVIVANAYGADTAVAVVQVIDCSGAAVPYFEDFEGVTAEGWNSAYGNLPECWGNIAIGASHRPKVVDSYQYISNLPNQALLIMAGTYSGYADAAYVLLPLFSDSLQRLSVAFDYRCESASYGTLTVGYWNDSLLTFHPVRNLASHTGLLYARDTVSFADVASVPHPTHTHIALKWYCNTSYYGVAVDNLEVFRDATMDISVDSVSAHCVTLSWQPVDSATAYHVSVAGIIDTTVASTAVTLCGLTINSQYTASVAAIVGGDIGQGTTVAFSTPSLNPAMLEVDSVGSRCVGLSWSACSGALAYNVVIDGVVDTVVADTAVVICGLETQTQYTARVRGINGTDTGLYATVQFSTPCVIVDLPWFEDFQGGSPLACWSKRGIGYYGMQICTEYYWEDYCHSGSRGLQMYNYTDGNTLVVSTPVIEAPADELLVSFWVCNPNEEGGLLEAGVITDPTDSTTFVPLMQCTMTDTPTRYEFDTRNVNVSGNETLAFRTTVYCTAMIIDDINVEQISTCARLRSVGSYALDARTAVVEWQYDTASAIPNTGALITLTDLTNSSIAPFVTDATGNSYTFGNLTLGHRYLASVQALCTDDTSVALTTEVVPTGNPCAEVTGPYNSGWFLMNCDRPYSYSQSLYPAVLAASIDTLFGIAYHLTSSSVEQYPNSNNTYSSGPRLVDVYIGQTSNTTLTAPVSATYLTLAVQNYELPVSDTGWVHINFTTPVPLDGVSNLIVTLDDNTGAIYGDVEFGHHTSDIGTCFRTSTSSYSYTQTYDPYNPAGFSPMAGTQIPDIQLLGGCSSDRCLQPIATVTDESEQSVSLGWYQRGNETQWQVEYHIDGDSTWIVAGITNDTVYTVVGLNAATGYRLRVASLCSGGTIYGDILSAHTQCGTVSLPYHQTFRNYDIPNNQSSITEGGTPCWQTGNITLLSQGRGLWNTHQNGDYIISPEIGIDLSLVRVTLSASGSTFFNAGIKVGVCDSMGGNLVWLDTITLSDNAQDYIVHLNSYTGSDHHLAIGGSYESWYLYDVLLEQAASCLPVHHIALSHLDDESISFCWPPIDASHSWAVYLDGTLIGTTNNTSYALSGLTSNTEYQLGVREVCGVGDTSEFTTLTVSTLCSTSLPYSENFESYVYNSLPDCWYLDERPHTGSSHNAWILSSASTDAELRMGDYYSPYEVEDTLANFICSPMLQVANHSVSISFVASSVTINWGTCQVGIMTNAADTDSFIALATITPTIHDSIYQLSTTGMSLPAKFALAFRWYGYTYCSVDDINVTIEPSYYTIDLAVNDTAMGSVSGAGTFEDGSTVTVTATPNEGYRFVIWSDSVTSTTRQITLRNSDISLTAYFEPVPQYTVTVNAVMNVGHYVGLADMVHGAGTYMDGDTVTLEGEVHGCAVSFVYWITAEGDTLYDNPHSFVIHSDVTITAVFAQFSGIGEIENSTLKIDIYPNPTHGDVTISVTQPSTFTVLDMTGRVVIAPTPIISSLRLPTTDLPAGVYFVRVGRSVRKLIVN
ncbi:MAG: choice-of-anchor J domain-containing protein [Bacteroidales bacterium]|nr:choice-of-anchor J domain-containing protein [Bacteroidales bacterium]